MVLLQKYIKKSIIEPGIKNLIVLLVITFFNKKNFKINMIEYKIKIKL